jgi:hypothetical protein
MRSSVSFGSADGTSRGGLGTSASTVNPASRRGGPASASGDAVDTTAATGTPDSITRRIHEASAPEVQRPAAADKGREQQVRPERAGQQRRHCRQPERDRAQHKLEIAAPGGHAGRAWGAVMWSAAPPVKPQPLLSGALPRPTFAPSHEDRKPVSPGSVSLISLARGEDWVRLMTLLW